MQSKRICIESFRIRPKQLQILRRSWRQQLKCFRWPESIIWKSWLYTQTVIMLYVTEWTYKWKENGWKTASGEDVKNKEIWMELANLAQDSKTKITWKQVAAHSEIPGNEEAEKLTMEAAKHLTFMIKNLEIALLICPAVLSARTSRNQHVHFQILS